MDSLFSLLTDVTVDGFALWIVLLICVGVFLGSFMDAIAGGGGIITIPTYLIAFSRLPAYYALGTNKLSSGIGTVFPPPASLKMGLWTGSSLPLPWRWHWQGLSRAPGCSTIRRMWC